MADLSLTAANLVDRLEEFCGWGTPTAAQSAWALERLNDGYRRFLQGIHLDRSRGQLAHHTWSWLTPQAELSIGGAVTGTASGTEADGVVEATEAIFDPSMVGLEITITDVDTFTITSYTSTSIVVCDDLDEDFDAKAVSVEGSGIVDLPDLFGGMIGPPVYRPLDGSSSPELHEKSPEGVEEHWRDRTGSGVAKYYATVAKTFTAATGQRWQLWLAPVPEEARVLLYQYRLAVAPLTDGAVYPVGGPDATEAILAASKWACEDEKQVRDGPSKAQYFELMDPLVDLDRSVFSAGDAPESLADQDMGM